jgi:hypothetical protein
MPSLRRIKELLCDDCRLPDAEVERLVEGLRDLANVVVDGFKASRKPVRDSFQPHGVKLVEIAAPSSGSGAPAVSSATLPTEPERDPSTADEPAGVLPISHRNASVPSHADVEKWVAEESQRGLCEGESHDFL